MPVRILVVDDYAPFRDFVRGVLQARPELHIIGEACDGHQAIQEAQKLTPELILLDIGMPTLNGIEAAKKISELLPDAKIIFVTQENDPDVVATALSNGAKGLVLKVNAHRELLPAVGAVLEGRRFIGFGVTQRLPNNSQQHDLQ